MSLLESDLTRADHGTEWARLSEMIIRSVMRIATNHNDSFRATDTDYDFRQLSFALGFSLSRSRLRNSEFSCIQWTSTERNCLTWRDQSLHSSQPLFVLNLCSMFIERIHISLLTWRKLFHQAWSLGVISKYLNQKRSRWYSLREISWHHQPCMYEKLIFRLTKTLLRCEDQVSHMKYEYIRMPEHTSIAANRALVSFHESSHENVGGKS